MTPHRWTLAFCFSLVSVFGTGESQSVSTAETLKYICRTFGSGVVQPFNGSGFHVRSNCPFTLARFTHNRVEYDLTARRDNSGLLTQLEITVNKIRTIVRGGSIEVEKRSVSLPYDHTYQRIFKYGTYTKLRSSLLPVSVTWHNVSGGIDVVMVELEHELSIDLSGLCGKLNVPGNRQQLIAESVLTEETCQIRDPVFAVNPLCRLFFSYTLDCLDVRTLHYVQLCEENIYTYESSTYISCAFFREIVQQCGNHSYIWNIWRTVTRCAPPNCPGDLAFVERGAAFVPSCSNPNPRVSDQDLTSSCVCPEGTVVNDHAEGVHCVKEANCPCVFAGRSYSAGDMRSTKCQSCVCEGGKWHCSEDTCPVRCLLEGQFVTTFDGKQYVVPGKCTYVVSQGHNWTVVVQFWEKEVSLKTAVLQLFQETYTFSHDGVKVGEEEITELHQSDHALVFWQSSMYIQVQTSFGMNIQVQTSPDIQLYITLPRNHTGVISGLCGNSNNDTTDDFTTSSGIIENSPQAFALSWSVGTCSVNIPPSCSSTDSEIFADEGCSALNKPTGIFAPCHSHIPTDHFHTACIQRTCNCGNNLQQCLCVALGSYAKACASLGVAVGDWRKATNCTLKCQKNQEFSYDVRACNHTCRLLSGPDPRCWLDDAPVEGCGCPEGTHLNQGHVCTPKAECVCHYYGGTTPPGPVVIDGRQCLCENGELHCSNDCGCRNGKVCVHCSDFPVNTAQKTCESLSKPVGARLTCESGCHCPHDQYEDHRGNCVTLDNCTCVYSGKMFSAGQRVKTNCKTCVCGQGQWHCEDEPCPGRCQVYGNRHYQTFDSKWFRFNGHCQYTLVEDYCGNDNGSFSVRVESVPCCDEALTCSRSIVMDLQGTVTLTLSDMRVTRRLQKGWTLRENPFYTTRTVGLYIVISVPSRGITLVWDKHTRLTVELHPDWRNRVCGLCGNFDSSEMNDLQISGSAVVSSPLAFGNYWKSASPPCSDVTTEIFPCERNSYCSAWAQRRCMLITADTFKDCHLKVDPEPYYHACVQESCSCEFEGKFLGFCTAVAAYAEACSQQDACVKWRTPDLCPVYCDFYNEQGQCSWHYEACGEMLACGKGHYFAHKLEGCYPRCLTDAPFYDENTGECTGLRNCTCFFNDSIVQPGAVVMIESIQCPCENGNITCPPAPTTTSPTTSTSIIPSTTASTPMETTVPSTTTTVATTMETWTATSSTTPTTTASTALTAITNVSTTTETSTSSNTSTPTTTESLTTSSTTPAPPATSPTSYETWTTPASTTPTPPTTAPTTYETWTPFSSTTPTPPTIAPTSYETWTPISSTTPTPPTTAPTSYETWTPISSTTPTPPTIAPTSYETWTPISSTTPTPPTTAPTTYETWTPISSTTPTPPTTAPMTYETWTPTSSTTPTPSTTAPTTYETWTPTSSTATAPTTYETWTPTSSTATAPTTYETWTPTSSTTPTPPTTAPTTYETWTTTASTTPEPPTTAWATASSATPTQPKTTDNVPNTTELMSTTSTASTKTTPASTSTETWTTMHSTSSTPTSTASSTTERWTPSTITTPFTTSTDVSPTTANWLSDFSSIATPETAATSTTILTPVSTAASVDTTPVMTEGTTADTSSTQTTITHAGTHPPATTFATNATPEPTTSSACTDCTDLKRKKTWTCGETWTEDCSHRTCANGTIELTPVVCPDTGVPICPRGQVAKVSDGCCETWKCDCRCELYGDPHYISFAGVPFDFLDKCTVILVEEQSPRHRLSIAVDNFYCVPGFPGSCVKGIILTYQDNVAALSIVRDLMAVEATLNNVTIQPPYEEQGLRFETTGYTVSIYLPEVRSYVSLSPSYTMVVNLAMEHFLNNTQGQCGVCGGASCIRRGGQIEDNSCCDKTAYDWVSADPLDSACASLPKDVPCLTGTTSTPHTNTPTSTTSCPANSLCELLDGPVFQSCRPFVNLQLKKKNCEFDSCGNTSSPCSALQQAAEECKRSGICIDWRNLTHGICDVTCQKGLVYRECHDKLDDFCYGGVRYQGASFEKNTTGCFCPSGKIRAGNHSSDCVSECLYCKGPLGEPRLPGEVWKSNCHLCTCNNQTLTEECFPKSSKMAPLCNTCPEKTCSYKEKTYKVGDLWTDAVHPCMWFRCSKVGIQTERRVCPKESCPEGDRVWDDQHCCFTCNQSCAPRLYSFNITIENCTTTIELPVCQGQCVSEPRVVLRRDLQVEHNSRCCLEQSSQRRSLTLQCLDLTTRRVDYRHITGCECSACSMLY